MNNHSFKILCSIFMSEDLKRTNTLVIGGNTRNWRCFKGTRKLDGGDEVFIAVTFDKRFFRTLVYAKFSYRKKNYPPTMGLAACDLDNTLDREQQKYLLRLLPQRLAAFEKENVSREFERNVELADLRKRMGVG